MLNMELPKWTIMVVVKEDMELTGMTEEAVITLKWAEEEEDLAK